MIWGLSGGNNSRVFSNIEGIMKEKKTYHTILKRHGVRSWKHLNGGTGLIVQNDSDLRHLYWLFISSFSDKRERKTTHLKNSN